MISNTKVGVASKGSKLMMQKIANLHKKILDERLRDTLIWISPIEKDNYKEYSLNERKIFEYLGYCSLKNRRPYSDFWPSRQPQWDGLAIGKNKTLYLFEAKSHLSEISGLHIKQDRNYRQQQNDELKINSIKNSSKYYNCKNYSEDVWVGKYYQIANRLSFLQKLKDLQIDYEQYSDVKLVFINFINDNTLISSKPVKCSEEWDNHYLQIFKEMCLDLEVLKKKGVLIINIDVSQWT